MPEDSSSATLPSVFDDGELYDLVGDAITYGLDLRKRMMIVTAWKE